MVHIYFYTVYGPYLFLYSLWSISIFIQSMVHIYFYTVYGLNQALPQAVTPGSRSLEVQQILDFRIPSNHFHSSYPPFWLKLVFWQRGKRFCSTCSLRI
ncbi:hypothetical protein SKAU_G00116490 [Synaphobranchus kaupii]|uniref:Uncharacterized protein n=1 Tax=Synaphobranchus kaupii TaxID=118154 RepID=A0A9Q1FMW0_SYNKA|nr:hypothetical protein SKAU_G00116490 [Synaphobranchus kaupii]